MTYVLLAHLAATLFMVGVIWFVQVVHYPLFARVGSERFDVYSEAHSRLTTYVVGPPMLVEAATALLLVFRRPEGVPLAATLIGLALVAVVWLSTALLQVPRHTTLGSGFDRRAWGGLVLSNWVRTVAWSARGGLVLWMAARAVG
ncbi:MAG: hypothetical protein-transmembrane region and signal peptide prediction [uncultured Rubrobacteraceae bacterium]|uniref:DUF1772 domain-containing protein n=1 Tax=uncultured Rubrobacteraceae bacterium TaxID=349277 RepID=A0A6J4Q1V7_9ACTN|nr:MAG: hypothetical protein-transmembrane region and signal peptide prediction [uncultured Rubrobacteraceae bacterium]